MSQSSVAPKFAASKLFRGSNQGPDSLIGRDKELADLDAAWSAAAKKNVIAIVAWGGVGKTSLVAHWAAGRLAQSEHSGIARYFDWSLYRQGTRREGDPAGASHAVSGDLFLKEALEFFGDPALAASNAGAWQKGERLAQLIGQHRTLLILDGLEPLQDARTGELRDDGLRALLRGLAQHNAGLCLVTTREHLPELATWQQTTAPEWKLEKLTDEAGAALLSKLGVKGTEQEKWELSAKVKGHALTLTLLGNYLRKAHRGDIRRVDRVDFQKVNEKEQGGHAFRVIAAYERWFEQEASERTEKQSSYSVSSISSSSGSVELAILRMLGLFDRPATPDCLAALRDPPIAGLTDALATLKEDEWNEAVTHLVELNLIEEQPWEPRRVVGYSEEKAKEVWKAVQEERHCELGEPKPFENRQSPVANRNSLDAHPLIREFFGKRFQETNAVAWKAAHSRLFEHLRTDVPYWPEGLDGLQALFHATGHGCEAGRHQEAFAQVYVDRMWRGRETHYCTRVLGAASAELGALSSFFDSRWQQPSVRLSPSERAGVLRSAGFLLRAVGRLTEAIEAMKAGMDCEANESGNKAAQTEAALYLSEMSMDLGELNAALEYARKAVDLAAQCPDKSLYIGALAQEGCVHHQAGRPQLAQDLFEKAEKTQASYQHATPKLYSLAGFHYCAFLLDSTPSEVGWRDCRQRAAGILRWSRKARPSSGEGLSPYPARDRSLAMLMLGWCWFLKVKDRGSETLLKRAKRWLDRAVQGVSKAETHYLQPLAFVYRAHARFRMGDAEGARPDLEAAWQIAERGPMRLHLADIHLHRARLFFREKQYPWKSPQDDLVAAKKLIDDCGYHRRDEELADAKQAILGQ